MAEHIDMKSIPAGRYGAKRASQDTANPRAVLRDIMDENPTATERQVRRLAADIILNDDAMVLVVFEGWFANEYRNLSRSTDGGRGGPHRSPSESSDGGAAVDSPTSASGSSESETVKASPPEPSPEDRFESYQAREKDKEKIKDIAEAAAQAAAAQAKETIRLHTIMPNGKEFMDCTKAELSGFRSGYNDGFDKVIARMADGQTVRDIVSNEDELKSILQ